MPSKTVVIYKANPKDMERIDNAIAQLKAAKNGECKDIKREPIGFGVEVIRVAYLIDEKKEGALEALNKELEALSELESIEVEAMTLL